MGVAGLVWIVYPVYNLQKTARSKSALGKSEFLLFELGLIQA